MPLPVTVTFANPDPGAAPSTLAQFIALLRTLVGAEVTGSYLPYVVGATTPSVDDQDKVWHKLDGDGRPIGTYFFYRGNWRRLYNGSTSEARVFTGDPSLHFDSTGLGTLGGEWDGWAMLNGQNEQPDLSNKFVIAGNMNNDGATGYDSGWRTTIDGSPQQTGGRAAFTLDADTTYRKARPEIKRFKWSADGNTGRNGGNMLGDTSSPGVSEILLPEDTGKETPDQISIVNPFYAFALVGWIGYA